MVPEPPEMVTVMDNVPPIHSVIFVGWVVTVISWVITTVTTLLMASPQPLPGVLIGHTVKVEPAVLLGGVYTAGSCTGGLLHYSQFVPLVLVSH
jgi:hypothetical protein